MTTAFRFTDRSQRPARVANSRFRPERIEQLLVQIAVGASRCTRSRGVRDPQLKPERTRPSRTASPVAARIEDAESL
jgi:hypothetical protein